MMRNLSVVCALLLVVAIAGPAIADTATFTNAAGDNNYANGANWTITADANGSAYGWADANGLLTP